jgi:flagellar biosynthesis protein
MKQQSQPLRAIALHYDGDNAPTVTASGEGDIAAEIIRIAKQHNIPLREDAALADMLKDMQLPMPLLFQESFPKKKVKFL